MRSLITAILLTIITVGSLLKAQTPEDTFALANEHYRAGGFSKAIIEYERVTKQGYASAPLFFNLGNAYYRSGEIGKAILAYERASRLDPGDPDIAFNLKLSNLRIVDRIEPVPELFLISWLRTVAALLSASTVMVLFVLFWILLFGSLALVNLIPHFRWIGTVRWGILTFSIAVVLFGSLLAVQLSQVTDTSDAIILSQIVTAKNSPDPQSVDAFVIHEGLKVKLSDAVGEWVKITLADGKVGWIRAQECERI